MRIVSRSDKRTFEEWANDNGLTLTAKERRFDPLMGLDPWYCSFDQMVEIMDGGLLTTIHGNGMTPEQARDDLAQRLAGKRIAVDAFKPWRKEIECHNSWDDRKVR